MGWWFALSIVVLLVALAYVSTRSRDLVEVSISTAELNITPRGLNRVWAFRRRLSIPLQAVKGARVVSGTRDLPKGLRLPGTAIPGLMLAGTYVTHGEKSFYLLRDGKELVLLELEGHEYRRVAIQTAKPYDVVRRIHSALPSGTS